MGGGVIAGSYTLLGGAPGIGKSTLLLQVAEGLAKQKQKVFYISAEENINQTGLRAKRLALQNEDRIFIVHESSLNRIIQHVETIKPQVLIVDSIQTLFLQEVGSAPGTVSQVRECASQLMHLAKNTNTSVFLIGHVTKEGDLAGPRVLEHMVDTVLSFEGDDLYHWRLLRVLKNRFGPTNEMAVFEMSSSGLKDILNPSGFFISNKEERPSIGSCVFAGVEGSRPLLCELQALALPSYMAMPRRTAIGLDIYRLHLVLAVLDRYLHAGLQKCDVFVNVLGGLKLSDPGADLALAKVLLSSKKQEALPKDSCFFGEISLTGELIPPGFVEERVKEAIKLQLSNIYLPKRAQKKTAGFSKKEGVNFHWISSVKDLA